MDTKADKVTAADNVDVSVGADWMALGTKLKKTSKRKSAPPGPLSSTKNCPNRERLMTDADKIYDELSRLTALVNTAVRDHQINMFDRTAVIHLDQFTEMQLRRSVQLLSSCSTHPANVYLGAGSGIRTENAQDHPLS